jgi:hypothetical protein
MTTPATNSTLYSLGLLTTTVEYTSGSGTIDLPKGAKFVSFTLIGGGGGGGSGRRGAASNTRSGGTGGRGGARVQLLPTPVSVFTWPLSYSVGAGGSGAAAITVDNTSGAVGVAGGDTTITSNGTIFKAVGGAGGRGGLTGTTSGAVFAFSSTGILDAPVVLISQVGSPSSNLSAGVANPADITSYQPGFGNAGGSINSSNTVLAAGRAANVGSANVYQILGGLAGSPGSEVGKNGNTSLLTKIGTGGGGGVTKAGTFAGNAGGNGALYGGGGGGGSASVNLQNSGAGGNGAGGLIQVTFYY